ncbi:TSL-kinase interacting protein 1 [Wolffia australiana]
MPPQSETNSVTPPNLPSDNNSCKSGEGIDSTLASAAADVPQKAVKKPTRQWAAWTRQEEESFFNALRQVGKNFEKITCRVQSKNKEQVRHYYYRLVRRMNKLLGPGFCLDAKNWKDTNAAMLRWWSLLEKYSCTASKLHLKPRRFKTFIETLAQQLLRDRNRNRRKRPYQGENGSVSIPTMGEPTFNKPTGHDVHLVKFVFVDSQNSQKLGATRLAATKRGVIRSDGPVSKNPNQKRRAGVGSSAYKKWEKAAIAGVSLVADAAEHLERTSIDNNCSLAQGTTDTSAPNCCTVNAGESADCAQPQHSLAPEEPCLQQPVGEPNSQPPSKLKLQLFPIDEATRKSLEKDERNPHLELTLSARKRISSILEHLNRKWGDSSVASGELMLFPYHAHQDNLAHLPRWTLNNSSASAGDVHATVGSPAVFRLRYGWFSSPNVRPLSATPTRVAEDGEEEQKHGRGAAVGAVTATPITVATTSPTARGMMSAGEWADSLTNISVGDLLTEASRAEVACAHGPAWPGASLSCDSFDAAIAGFMSCHHDSSAVPTLASILDAEETCDEFSFHKVLCREDEKGAKDGDMPEPARAAELMEFAWPDSLGPLELDVPPARFEGQDLLFGDGGGSLGGLSRLVASSLDAFQNCSFFVADKDPHSVGGAQAALSYLCQGANAES